MLAQVMEPSPEPGAEPGAELGLGPQLELLGDPEPEPEGQRPRAVTSPVARAAGGYLERIGGYRKRSSTLNSMVCAPAGAHRRTICAAVAAGRRGGAPQVSSVGSSSSDGSQGYNSDASDDDPDAVEANWFDLDRKSEGEGVGSPPPQVPPQAAMGGGRRRSPGRLRVRRADREPQNVSFTGI
jgi:hypothetical protein